MDLKNRVEKALDKIRPYLEADGGDVKVIEIIDGNVAVVEFLGACGDCPMSAMTFKAGVENAIIKEVPEITEVRATNLTPVSSKS